MATPATTIRQKSNPETSTKNLPVEEQIRRRAYERYLARVGQAGAPLDDWLEAEAEITAQEQLED